jgi:serine/threonine protein kinase
MTLIGKSLAHYDILEKIGEGGMGEVYRARDTQLDRSVALKILPTAVSQDPGRRARFTREAKILASLSHPGIAAIHGLHEQDDLHFLAMELIPGETLASSIPEAGYSLDRLLEIVIPLTDAVAFAHDQGVIHRDLKPANVMLSESGRIRVLDFGIASLRESEEPGEVDKTLDALTGAGEILGTVAYMAPEQLEGRSMDQRVDVFALGVILYEMATGISPFKGDSTVATASAILRDDPPPLSAKRPDMPQDVSRIVRRCLEKDPEYRIQTAKDVRNELLDLRRHRQENQRSEASKGGERVGSPVEHRFILTTNLVRQLSVRIPRMVGDAMTYLDNEVDSDTLVVYLHGIGRDQSEFAEVLPRTPFRGMALSIYGFGSDARARLALPIEDHLRLLRAFIDDVDRRFRPRTKVLVGMSSGADHCLRLVASPEGADLDLDGLIVLGPNWKVGSAFISRFYTQLTDDPSHVLSVLKSLDEPVESLSAWLTIQNYLLSTFRKFGTDVVALRQYSEDIVSPFRDDEDVFYQWFRRALERVPHVRCVFAEEESEYAEAILARHLEENILGEAFHEDAISVTTVGHMDLTTPGVLVPVVQHVVSRAEEQKGA